MLGRWLVAFPFMVAACSRSDPPKSRRDTEAPTEPTPTAADFARLASEATTIRDRACACKDHRCAASVSTNEWDPFVERNARQLDALRGDERKTMEGLMSEILAGCERKAQTATLPRVHITNECFMRKPASSALYFHVVLDDLGPPGSTPAEPSKTIYNMSCQEDGTCSGVRIDLRPAVDGGHSIENFGTLAMTGGTVTSAANGIAMITWGIHTFILDANLGTVEHKDTSGTHGTATCVPVLGS